MQIIPLYFIAVDNFLCFLPSNDIQSIRITSDVVRSNDLQLRLLMWLPVYVTQIPGHWLNHEILLIPNTTINVAHYSWHSRNV